MTKNRYRRLSLLFIASSFLLLSCATPGPPPGPNPAQIAGQEAKTIVLAPLNIVSSLPPELEGSTKMISAALVDHLEAHGKTVRVIGFRAGRDLWKSSMKEVRDSGEKRNFENAARVYARRIGEQLDFDVLIVPSVFIQNAKMRARTVRWDGAEQEMVIEGGINSKRANLYQGNMGQKGGYSGRETVSQELVNDTPAIQDKERVRAGVAAALSPFLSEEVPPPTTVIPEEEVVPAQPGDVEPS